MARRIIRDGGREEQAERVRLKHDRAIEKRTDTVYEAVDVDVQSVGCYSDIEWRRASRGGAAADRLGHDSRTEAARADRHQGAAREYKNGW